MAEVKAVDLPGSIEGSAKVNISLSYTFKKIQEKLGDIALKHLWELARQIAAKVMREVKTDLNSRDVQNVANLLGREETRIADSLLRLYIDGITSVREAKGIRVGLLKNKDETVEDISVGRLAYLLEYGSDLRSSDPVWRKVIDRHKALMPVYKKEVMEKIRKELKAKLQTVGGRR